jgi:hypothetical protein
VTLPSGNATAPAKQDHQGSASLKLKAIEEFKIFWAIAIYLAVMLGAFASYRRFVLSESGISYLHYGGAVVEALILAKVILIGQALGLGKRVEGAPLIVSAIFKSLIFGVFVALFGILEHAIEGLLHHHAWNQIVHELFSTGREEILARTVVMIVTFIPFFAFWEIDRVLGKGKLVALFFRTRPA